MMYGVCLSAPWLENHSYVNMLVSSDYRTSKTYLALGRLPPLNTLPSGIEMSEYLPSHGAGILHRKETRLAEIMINVTEVLVDR